MSWLDGARQRLWELLRPGGVAAELDDELADHFERELERQREAAGSPDAARRQARRRAGSAVVARESVADGRTGRIIADAVSDLRFGARAVRRNPGLAVAVVLSFALGIGGTTAIFSVVHAVLLRPLAYPASGEIHDLRVWWNDFSSTLSAADFLTVTGDSPLAGRIGGYFFPEGGFAMATREGPQVVNGGFISDRLPQVLGVGPILGPGFSPDGNAREALIGDALWREHFGARPDAIGSTVTLDGDTFIVVGVMPAGFNLPGRQDERVWVRARLEQPGGRGPFFIRAVVRLDPGVTRAATESILTGAATPVLRERYGVSDKWRYGLRPLKDVLVGDTRQTLLLLFAAVALVLLIAVANVANLLLARHTVRTREIAVRASLGAHRGRLVRQLLAEYALLGLIGGLAGLALAIGIVHVIRTEAVTIVPRIDEVRVNLVVALFALATGVGVGLAAGLLPALRLPWGQLSEWLRAGGRGTGQHVRHGAARRMLVIAEVALALTVVASAALLVKSLLRLQQFDPGFRPEGVMSFRLALPDQPYSAEERTRTFLADLEARLKALPDVQTVGAAMSLPPNLLVMSNNYTLEGAADDTAGARGVVGWNIVTRDYFETMGITVLRGRVFDARDSAEAPDVAMLSDAFVRRHFPGEDPLGKRLKGGSSSPDAPWTTVIGVVADVPYENGAWSGSSPMVYTAYSQNLWWQSPFIVIRSSGDPAALVPAVRGVVTSLDRRVPLRDVSTMRDRLYRANAVPRFLGLLFSALATLALVLAVTGIYGIMSYDVTQRRRETAVRRALGARSDQIVVATFVAGVRVALAGIVLGTAGALVLTGSLSALLYQVSPRDPAVLASAAAVLVTAALGACIWPALRAARVDPAMLLREE